MSVTRTLAKKIVQNATSHVLSQIPGFTELRSTLAVVNRLPSITKDGMPKVIGAYGVLGFLARRISSIQSELKPLIVDHVLSAPDSKTNGKRTRVLLDDDFGEAMVDHVQPTEPKVKDLLALLHKKGLQPLDACDPVTDYTVSPAKLATLIRDGILTKTEIDELCKPSYTLTVKVSAAAEKALDN